MEDNSMLNKKPEDLTVGEALKINAVVTVVIVGTFAAIAAAPTIAEKAKAKYNSRKAKKNEES